MRSPNHRLRWLVFSIVVAAVSLLALPAIAQRPEPGRLWVVVKVADNVLADRPARASVTTTDGVLLDYAEALLARAPNQQSFLLDHVPAGTHDVRVEGEGFVTEVKKGVTVFDGRDETVSIVIRPGTGVHIVEYAVAGLSREEVAARLRALEADTAQLKAAIQEHHP